MEEKVKKIAQSLMKVLHKYVHVHNEFFEVSARTILPWPFGKPTDFKAHYDCLSELVTKIELINREIRDIITEDKESISINERDYLNALIELYIPPLADSISKLRDICYKLEMKDVSMIILDYIFFGYNIFAYRKDIKEYEYYVNKYTSLGDKMNYLYNKIE